MLATDPITSLTRTRRERETFRIGDVTVSILKVSGGKVKLNFRVPKSVKIQRVVEEVMG